MVEIRRAVRADVSGLMALAAKTRNAPAWSEEIYLAMLRGHAAVLLKRSIFVAEVEGELAGFVVLSTLMAAESPESEIEAVVVSEGFQRRGVGRELCAVALADARSLGTGRMLLEVRTSNKAAIGLYVAVGFVETGMRPRYYADPEEDALLMELTL